MAELVVLGIASISLLNITRFALIMHYAAIGFMKYKLRCRS